MHTHAITLLRRALAILIAVILAWVGYDYVRTWRSRAGAVKQAARILGSDLIRSAESIEYSEHENGRLRFKIRAQKLLETRAGKNLLEGIEAFDFNPDGLPRNHIRSKRAEYDREKGRAFFSGDVRIQMEKDIELLCDSLSYDLKSNIGTTDDEMRLVSPQARGSARGIRFDNAGRILELKGAVDLEVRRRVARPGGGPVPEEKSRVTSDRVFYSEKDPVIRFMGNARLDATDAVLSGADIIAWLSPDRRRIAALMCRGNATYVSKKPGDAQVLRGDRIDFDLSKDGKAVERIRVNGGAVFSSAAKEGGVELKGSEIRVDLNPVNASIQTVWSRSDVRFRSWRGPQVTRIGGQDFTAEFSPGTSSVKRLLVKEDATLIMTAGEAGEADELAARKIQVEFTEAAGQSKPRHLQADGSVRWTSAERKGGPGRKAEPGRTLTAASLEMVYSESGEALERGSASGSVRISMLPVPGDQGLPMRRLEADKVRFGFYPVGNRLRELEGEDGVRVTYQSSSTRRQKESSAGEVQTTSERLKATFRESDGQADTVSQWGAFTYKDGTRTATSGRADYDAGNDALVLTDSPKVTDPDSTTTGDELVYHLQDRQIVVRGNVRSVTRPRQQDGSPFPASNSSSSTTIVTAQLMRYWTEEGKARYEDGVHMLSEQGQLHARTVEILDSGRELAAAGQVRHIIFRRAERPDAKPSAKPAASDAKQNAGGSQTLIRSSQLRFDSARNVIHYSGNVVLDTGDIRMSSDTLDATLDPEGKQIEWARAIGNLRIEQQGRMARGNQADYILAPGKFVVLGDPAEIKDPVRGRSAARRLTFFTSDDRIILENS